MKEKATPDFYQAPGGWRSTMAAREQNNCGILPLRTTPPSTLAFVEISTTGGQNKSSTCQMKMLVFQYHCLPTIFAYFLLLGQTPNLFPVMTFIVISQHIFSTIVRTVMDILGLLVHLKKELLVCCRFQYVSLPSSRRWSTADEEWHHHDRRSPLA